MAAQTPLITGTSWEPVELKHTYLKAIEDAVCKEQPRVNASMTEMVVVGKSHLKTGDPGSPQAGNKFQVHLDVKQKSEESRLQGRNGTAG
ncbi:hypothetical protein PG985_007603 [Apiospora marii]|uniref:uncharacterized protein n=1 Tax=Apiospora marii TaxID=335849 RepID=UPI00312E46B7